MSKISGKVNHLAIIMDGNGRWAEARNLERTAGHRAGADNVLKIMQAAKEFESELKKEPDSESETPGEQPKTISEVKKQDVEVSSSKESI